MKILYVNYGNDDSAFEVRNDFLFPRLEELGFVSQGKDDDEWPVPDDRVAEVEQEIERMNERYSVKLYTDWSRG